MKEDKSLYQKLVSKVTLHFVWGHLSKKQTVLCFSCKILITYHIICLQCLYKWIQLQQEEMTKAGESNVELIIDHYVQHILPLVRYNFEPLFLTWIKKFIEFFSYKSGLQ